jgi:hypothetical protein
MLSSDQSAFKAFVYDLMAADSTGAIEKHPLG